MNAPAIQPLEPPGPLDIVYLFRHSKHQDEELRFSLRSLAKNLLFIRKVWIFGDRPSFLTDDLSIVEHIPHAYVAPLLGYKIPVRNDFLMLFLASLIPGVAFDFVRFSDDYIVLQPLSREQLCTVRALEDLNQSTTRGKGKWKELLWRTFDLLKEFGYAGYNFESHVPQPLNRQMVFETFMAFREFQSEERYAGMLSGTAIYNFALRHYGLPFVWLADEQSRAGFYGSCPAEDQIAKACCRGKLFLTFDDNGFGPFMGRFLEGLFSEPCRFERST
jgi:hypothetical protein